MTQPRRPAGTPVGGQFAPASRPEASGIHLVEDDLATNEHDEIRQALLEIEQLGAKHVDRIVSLGKVATALPNAARSVVADVVGQDDALRDDPERAFINPLADIALARAVRGAGFEHGLIENLVSELSAQDMQTSFERAARFHVRDALRHEPAGDTSWVCPADPSHATRDGICTSCGAMRSANMGGEVGEPPVEVMEPNGEDAEDAEPSAEHVVAQHAGSAAAVVPSKPERVLRELVSELYRLQNEANEGNDDDMASAFDRAAEMLDAAITDAFSGYEQAPRSQPSASRSDVHIDLSNVDFIEAGDPEEPGGAKAQLYGTIQIGQVPFHVMALQVTSGDDEPQVALQRDEDLASAMEALGDQGPYETVEIDGRCYVLLISPHAR